MKNIKYIKWALCATLALFMGSCIDDDLNNDPTASTQMDPNIQLTTIQLLPSTNSDDWHRYLIYPGGFMNQWSNDWATVNYGGVGQKNDSYFAHMWDVYYPSIIREAVDIVERTRDLPEYQNVHAAGRIVKVENFLRLTDYYGDIPYFGAGKAYYEGIFKPEYDKQEDIYNDFFKELKEAAEQFDSSKPGLTADIYFNGDLNKWKKYANSLRLRIAMRLIKVNPERAKIEAEAAASSGLMTSNADICYVQHDNVQAEFAASSNGIANRMLRDRSSTFRITSELIGTLESMNDPRLLFYGGSYLEDDVRTDITPLLLAYYGKYKDFTLPAQQFSWSYDKPFEDIKPLSEITLNINGTDTKVSALLQYMQPSKLVSKPGSPYIRMSYAEVEFLLADAVQRGYNVGGTASSHYKAGLEAAVRQWTLFGASINEPTLTTFLNSNILTSGNELNQINTQLWVLHFLNPFETWANWRRTGLPVNQVKFHNYHAGNQSGGQTPRRVQYPVSEQTSNPDGYKAAVARMGGTDDWLNRVWWDKN